MYLILKKTNLEKRDKKEDEKKSKISEQWKNMGKLTG